MIPINILMFIGFFVFLYVVGLLLTISKFCTHLKRLSKASLIYSSLSNLSKSSAFNLSLRIN